MITINTNVNNLKLQRNLNSVNSNMQNALSRISTGYKINNASDDAAGMVISKALETQTRGLNVANNNAQMATNLLSVADGALGQMSELTMRIRDLATQSSNGVYSNTERKALDLEAEQLTNNLEQLVKGTKFNEYNVFKTTTPTTKGITTEAEAIAQGYEVIKTADELKAALTASDALNNTNKKVMLFNDINLDDLGIVNGNNWTAVGTNTSTTRFKGTFDGNGYTISNLKINKPTNDNQGFFGHTQNATIKNTSLENADVKGKDYIGGLAGILDSSTIQNSCSTGNVEGGWYIGGLVGHTRSAEVDSSYSAGSVVGAAQDSGGFIGRATSSVIRGCISSASVVGRHSVGGFIGNIGGASVVTSSYSSGKTSGSGNYVGGFTGLIYENSKILNSYSTGEVSGQKFFSGGFVGLIGSAGNNATTAIENCYSTSDVY